MKWVNIGTVEALALVCIAAYIDKAHRPEILWGGGIAAAVTYAEYLYAKQSGLKSSEPGTETWWPVATQATLTPTNGIWATLVLTDAGLPTTKNNIDNMTVWMTNEEPATNWWDRNNPLNASLGTSASDGTGSYPDLTTAAAQTAKMIRQDNMSAIYTALKNDAPPATFGAAVISSPWASSHYGGIVSRFTGAPPSQNIVAGKGSTAGSGSGAGGLSATPTVGGNPLSASGTGCNAKGKIFGVAGISFSYCQGKALVSGLCIGLGGAVALIGIVLVIKQSSLNGAAKAAAGLLPSRSNGGSTQTEEDPATANARTQLSEQGGSAKDADYSRSTGNPIPFRPAKGNRPAAGGATASGSF
jgi:hypothetical protein